MLSTVYNYMYIYEIFCVHAIIICYKYILINSEHVVHVLYMYVYKYMYMYMYVQNICTYMYLLYIILYVRKFL